MRAVSTMSMALALPTARGRRCVPPAPGMMPSLISGWPNFARVGGDDEIAHHRQLAAAAEREARDRRDHRLSHRLRMRSQLRVMYSLLYTSM